MDNIKYPKPDFDRMRRRRARVMKRFIRRNPGSSSSVPGVPGELNARTRATGAASSSNSSRVFDVTMVFYLLIFFSPFIILLVGFL